MHDIKNISDVRPFQKTQDSIFSYYITRRFSRVITYLLIRFTKNPSPNMVSGFSFLLAVVAVGLFVHPEYWVRAFGALVIHISFAFDCADGEIARITNSSSKFGAWLDSTFDRFKEVLMFGAMTWYWYQYVQTEVWVLLVGFGAIVGLQLVSYLREAKKSSWPSNRVSEVFIAKNVYIGTVDVTIYLVSIAVLLNAQIWALWLFLAISVPLILKQLKSAYNLGKKEK